MWLAGVNCLVYHGTLSSINGWCGVKQKPGVIFHMYLTPDLWMQCLFITYCLLLTLIPNPLILMAFFFVWGPMNNVI